MLLGEVLVVVLDGDVEPAVRDDPPAVDRVLAGMVERDQLVVLRVVGEVEARGDADGLEGDLPSTLQRPDERRELALSGRPVPAADLDVDGVHLAPADHGHELVPAFLSSRRARHDLGVVAGEVERALVSQEVGCVEHEDVQGVALDPLSAVEEPPERAKLAADLDAAGHLHRRYRAHLVGDRADPADPGGDVGDLREAAPAQEGLEEAGRLIDVELDLLDLSAGDAHDHGALALDAGERVGLDRLRALLGHADRTSSNAAHVEGAKDAVDALLVHAEVLEVARLSAAMFGVSIGPKQP